MDRLAVFFFERGHSFMSLATESGVSRQTLHKWDKRDIRGLPKPGLALRVAHALGVDPADFRRKLADYLKGGDA